MAYCWRKLIVSASAAVCAAVCAAGACSALTLLSPTEGQAVREMVRIVVPEDAVPAEGAGGAPGFLTVMVGEGDDLRFVAAFSRESAQQTANKLTFLWNSKAPYHDPSAPMKQQSFKDGPYTLRVQVYDGNGKAIDSASVGITLSNRVPRSSPAPAVSLVNKLSFGQSNTYDVKANVEVYEVVARVGIPILGGLGMFAETEIIQSVEDVRPSGEMLLRYRIGDRALVSSGGVKTPLYDAEPIKPQLYRLVTRHGQVVKRNMFSKQAKYSFMDFLPVLPDKPVKEGDSWPDKCTVKVDGMTPLVELEGTSQLDSFEWQSGQECAKIISRLTGKSRIVLADGRIRGTGQVTADITTYFAYKTGRPVLREIVLEFPASIDTGAFDTGGFSGGPSPGMATPVPTVPSPLVSPLESEDDDEYPVRGPGVRPPSTPGGAVTGPGAAAPAGKKGTVLIRIDVRLEK